MVRYPPTKRFVSEELVAAHLEHLKLSTDTPLNSHSPMLTSSWGRALGGPNIDIGEPPHRLQMKTVASCLNSTECQVSRKRQLMDFCASEEKVQDSWASKRMRLDDRSPLDDSSSIDRDHCQDDSRAMPVTNLASIPEEAELNQQVLASSIHSNAKTREELTPSLHINPTLPSLSRPPPPPSPPVGSGDDIHPYSVWVAPEIQAMTDPPPLPASIMEEMYALASTNVLNSVLCFVL